MSPRLRIAITHPYSWPEVRRGAERIIVDMARALAEAGHEVDVFTAGADPVDRTTEHGYRLRRFRRRFGTDARHERWFGVRVAPALLRGRYDIVHSLMPYDGAMASRLGVAGHKTVYEEMGNPVRRLIEGRYDERARRRLIASADVFACMSPFSQSFLIDDWGRTGVLIPGGVRLADARPGSRAADPTVLFSGALHRPEKNVALLLEAIAIVAETRPDVRLQLSGPGDTAPLLAAAPEAARARTEVLPIGDPDGLADRYAAAWVTCLPTEWDSFGLVVIESLANGTPVVVGPVGGPADTVGRFDGVGVAAAALTAPALAEALLAGLDLAADTATAARCTAAGAAYDWDTAIVPLLESIYRDALG